MSFMRFLNLSIADDIPDSKTVWHFKEQLIDLEVLEPIFDLFLVKLKALGLIVNEGKIIDASFVEVPIQRNSKEKNKVIKEGKGSELWNDEPHKKAQKDIDARWTVKNNVNFFGYKNHAKVDQKSKIITGFTVTDASVHDSQETDNLLDENDRGEEFYGDSAYTGEKQERIIEKKGLKNRACEKGYKNKPLTQKQKESNKEKSKIRSRVEHIFGFMENSMTGMYLHSIGEKRIKGAITLMNLTYNMFRSVQLQSI